MYVCVCVCESHRVERCVSVLIVTVNAADLCLRTGVRHSLKKGPETTHTHSFSSGATDSYSNRWHFTTPPLFWTTQTAHEKLKIIRRLILEFGFRGAQDALVVLQLWAAVALINLQTVIQQVQILLHFLRLIHRVWVQNLCTSATHQTERKQQNNSYVYMQLHNLFMIWLMAQLDWKPYM